MDQHEILNPHSSYQMQSADDRDQRCVLLSYGSCRSDLHMIGKCWQLTPKPNYIQFF